MWDYADQRFLKKMEECSIKATSMLESEYLKWLVQNKWRAKTDQFVDECT
jgi:hypothetical protein